MLHASNFLFSAVLASALCRQCAVAQTSADFAKTGSTTMVNVGATYASPAQSGVAALECQNCTDEYFFTSTLAGTIYPVLPRCMNFRVRYTL